jgi:hypothetical protein
VAFLCHASDDKAPVRALYEQLLADGIRCWLDEVDLIPGQDWNREIEQAIDVCQYMLVCLSSRSVSKSGYVQRELNMALDKAREQPEGRIYLIPVRLDDCATPRRLQHLQWVDLHRDNGYQRLLGALRHQVDQLSRHAAD